MSKWMKLKVKIKIFLISKQIAHIEHLLQKQHHPKIA